MYSPEEGISKAPVTTPAGAAAEAGAKKTFLVRAAAAARVGHEQRRKDHEDCHDSDAELPSVPTWEFLQRLFGLKNFQSITYHANRTSKNVKKHFDNVMGVLLKYGYARPNPQHDESDLDSEPVLWTEAGKRRFFEFDETGFDLKGDTPSKAPSERMPCEEHDTGEAYNEHNSGDRVSGCGGTVGRSG